MVKVKHGSLRRGSEYFHWLEGPSTEVSQQDGVEKYCVSYSRGFTGERVICLYEVAPFTVFPSMCVYVSCLIQTFNIAFQIVVKDELILIFLFTGLVKFN